MSWGQIVQLRHSEIKNVVYMNQACNVPSDIRQDQRSSVELLAALDAAQLAGNYPQAVALIEQIYAIMDTDHAMTAQAG